MYTFISVIFKTLAVICAIIALFIAIALLIALPVCILSDTSFIEALRLPAVIGWAVIVTLGAIFIAFLVAGDPDQF